jgi:hypothetical protein
MTPTQQLPPVTFGPAKAQRGQRAYAGICCVTFGTGILVFADRAGRDEVGIVLGGILLAALGIVFLAARRGSTTIDAQGIRTSSIFGRRSCRWSDVTDVDLNIDASDGDPMVYSIKIRRRGGRAFTLPVPSDSSRKGRHANPDFNDQLATIRSYWWASTNPPQSQSA